MKYIVLILSIALMGCESLKTETKTTKIIEQNIKSIYDFSVEDIDGNNFDFKSLKGKKIMIVNTASKCGLTPQYKELQELYLDYKSSNFTIIAFPSNDFLWQEPGTASEIKAFCKKNYGVTFPLMKKVKVKNSKNQDPVYKYLTRLSQNGYKDSKVKWNFQKYLIGTSGALEKVVGPKVLPTDPEIINWITK